LPGSGFVAAGRRVLGYTVLVLLGLGAVLGAAVLLVERNPRMLAAELASRPGLVGVLGVVILVVAAIWVVVIVSSHRMVRPRTAPSWQRGIGMALVAVLCAAVIWPSALAAQAAFATHHAIETISRPDQVDADGNPVAPPDRENPWKGRPRVNILLLGGDAGEDRTGLRTDSVILASVDTTTGDAVLFSLPRNLQDVPFPKTNPLNDVYPDGYDCGNYCLLNAVYEAAHEHADLFPSRDPDPGLTTVQDVVGEILGLDPDYYVLVDLSGFERIVDALGGIDINVPERVPLGGIGIDGTDQPEWAIEEWIEPGYQHLDGRQALWFARDRWRSDDYQRMERQRCVLNAIVEQADPSTVIGNYLDLVTAAESIISTNVPPQLFPAFLELSDLVKSRPIRSLPFTDDVIVPSDPDFREIRQLVRAALVPPVPTTPPTSTAPPTTTAPATTSPDETESPSTTPTTDPSEAVVADEVCG
jgi:LCP family protein required for cell wall assembly